MVADSLRGRVLFVCFTSKIAALQERAYLCVE
jgi:hypothetical protein